MTRAACQGLSPGLAINPCKCSCQIYPASCFLIRRLAVLIMTVAAGASPINLV